MYCKNCGNKLEEGAKYCNNCGSETELEEKVIVQNNNTSPALITGIIACVLFWLPLVSIPLATASIIIYLNSKDEKKDTKAGMILGIISLILTIITIIIIALFTFFAVGHIDKAIKEFHMDDIDEKFDEFEERYHQKSSEIKGYSWKNTEDGSTLYLNSNETYTWYSNDNNHEDNYNQGKYKTYNGEEAINYISESLKEFGITEEQQRSFFQKDMTELNNYYLIILTNEKTIMNHEEKNETDNIEYYYGFYSEQEEKLNLTNIISKKQLELKKLERLSDIDI